MKYQFAKGLQKSDIPAYVPIFLNNFGYYREPEHDLLVCRPDGRSDYHLLLAFLGEITVGSETLVSGEGYIFYPGEPQNYTYRAGADAVYYWVHFSGTAVPALLSAQPYPRGRICFSDRAETAEMILRAMFSAYSGTSCCKEEVCASLFSGLLRLICGEGRTNIPFAAAMRRLNDISSPVRVAELAAEYRMSEAHFIRSFGFYAGITPHRYRRKKQCERAALLLVETDLTVKKIAEAVGFTDPLYFSRIFRAEVGVSPRTYRKSAAEKSGNELFFDKNDVGE